MKLDTALYQLKNFPVTFLRSNLLWIAGYHLSETRTYYFGYHDNFTQAQGTNEGFKFAPQNLFAASKTTGIDGKGSWPGHQGVWHRQRLFSPRSGGRHSDRRHLASVCPTGRDWHRASDRFRLHHLKQRQPDYRMNLTGWG
jgi:hypothetical protein